MHLHQRSTIREYISSLFPSLFPIFLRSWTSWISWYFSYPLLYYIYDREKLVFFVSRLIVDTNFMIKGESTSAIIFLIEMIDFHLSPIKPFNFSLIECDSSKQKKRRGSSWSNPRDKIIPGREGSYLERSIAIYFNPFVAQAMHRYPKPPAVS